MSGKGKPLSREYKEQIHNLLNEGKNKHEVAELLGKSYSSICRTIKKPLDDPPERTRQPKSSRWCAVMGCGNKSATPAISRTISLFRFPKDKQMRKAWEIATKRSGGKTATGGPWVSTKSSRLCHEHFRDDEINVIIGPDGNVARRELRENVVPTLKLPGKVDKSPRRTLVRHGVPAEEPLKLTGKNISSAEELRAYITRLDPLAKEKEEYEQWKKEQAEKEAKIFGFPQAVKVAKEIEAEGQPGLTFIYEKDRFFVTHLIYINGILRSRQMEVFRDFSVSVWENSVKFAGYRIFSDLGINPGYADSPATLRAMIEKLGALDLEQNDIRIVRTMMQRLLQRLKPPPNGLPGDTVPDTEETENTDRMILQFLGFAVEQLTLLGYPKYGRRFADHAPMTLQMATTLKKYSWAAYEVLRGCGLILLPSATTIDRDEDMELMPAVTPVPVATRFGSSRVTVVGSASFPALRATPETDFEPAILTDPPANS